MKTLTLDGIDFRLIRNPSKGDGLRLKQMLRRHGPPPSQSPAETGCIVNDCVDLRDGERSTLWDFLTRNWLSVISTGCAIAAGVVGLGSGVGIALALTAVTMSYLHLTGRVGMDHGLATVVISALYTVALGTRLFGPVTKVAFALTHLTVHEWTGAAGRTVSGWLSGYNSLPELAKWFLIFLVAAMLYFGTRSVERSNPRIKREQTPREHNWAQRDGFGKRFHNMLLRVRERNKRTSFKSK